LAQVPWAEIERLQVTALAAGESFPYEEVAKLARSRQLAFRSKNRMLAAQAVQILEEEQPMTLRQLYYRLISAGNLSNSQKEYKRLGALMTRLREAGELPRTWIVDHVRSTLKPSSWSGLADFGDTVRQAYRKDFWASLDAHVEVFVEKDAVAGTIQPITEEYDVALHVCRGYSSVSFAGEIADLWQQIEKPIFAYYLGDFDPSGFDLERDLRGKLGRYSGRVCIECEYDEIDRNVQVTGQDRDEFHLGCRDGMPYFLWRRLAIVEEDFESHQLIPLPVKHSDRRSKKFIEEYGSACAEVDALPPSELRQRVQAAIHEHIDQERWTKLQEVEEAEQKSLDHVLKRWNKKVNLDSVS
jgi:hypothetical protein